MGCLCLYMCASVPGVRGRVDVHRRVSVHVHVCIYVVCAHV